jgi:hypothetical protein
MKDDWVLVTNNMKFPNVTVDTEIEVLDMQGSYIVGKEFETGKKIRRKAGEFLWYRTSIHAYRIITELVKTDASV